MPRSRTTRTPSPLPTRSNSSITEKSHLSGGGIFCGVPGWARGHLGAGGLCPNNASKTARFDAKSRTPKGMRPFMSVTIRRAVAPRLEFALLGDVILQFADGNPDLLHGVTVTDGDAVVGRGVLIADGLEVHGDTQGGADFVLPAVTLADGAGNILLSCGFVFPSTSTFTS